jgi:hypothetical protein
MSSCVIVCGGRNYQDRKFLFEQLDRAHKKSPFGFIVQGGADGADFLAYEWARSREISCLCIPAKWSRKGKAAGPSRNRAMLMLEPKAVIAFEGGRGTADMIRQALDAGIPVWEPCKTKTEEN